jgi:GNAT superfamily N-acetyltransferase
MIHFQFVEEDEIHSVIPLLKLLNPKLSDELLKQRLDEMLTQGYKCIGIFDGDALIGACGLWILTKYYVGRHIEPDNVVILPEYRSRNIGSQLMEWIDDYARENGCAASEVNCYIGNEKAHKFWKKQGYEVIALHFQKKYEAE